VDDAKDEGPLRRSTNTAELLSLTEQSGGGEGIVDQGILAATC